MALILTFLSINWFLYDRDLRHERVTMKIDFPRTGLDFQNVEN